ncbi:MAG: ABC transporter ATP-binding protein [Devosia nanyangense]|uniref:ABC transporter ATP-binding protein n=1 Tax=Devosia nanyangense TaxID=1228055 RepID=A0A933L1D8_9HYPH|nr:ABC transporter ATP-binding protein [Devosia nanyangense]
MDMINEGALLEIDRLAVEFDTRRGVVYGLRGATLSIGRGETLAIVGESGSGKSVTAQAVMGLIDVPGRISGGDIRWKGETLLGPHGSRAARDIRGKEIALVFQDPMTSLNPLMKIGVQIGEVLRRHLGMSESEAHSRVLELLEAVGIPAPPRRAAQYPHELSGGMRQRVMIAMAIACEPQLLIADEPTTALDVTIQAQVLELLAGLQQTLKLSVLLITHDLGVVAGLCHRIAVMYAGRIVETGLADDVFNRPAHPYTQGLIRSTPRLDDHTDRLVSIEGAPPNMLAPPTGCAFRVRCPLAEARCEQEPPLVQSRTGATVACWRPDEAAWGIPAATPQARVKGNGYYDQMVAEYQPASVPAEAAAAASRPPVTPLLSVRDLGVDYEVSSPGFWGKARKISALKGISFDLYPGETLGLVGESGSGKTTTGRAVLRRLEASEGRIYFKGQDITNVHGDELRQLRRKMQLVFQDPYASLNPRMKILDIVAEPLIAHGVVRNSDEAREQITELLRLVGLSRDATDRFPYAFSGGQRQRVGIARALALKPEFIVADEPVSALDVSVRAQVVNLLQDLQKELGISYLFIAHDLSVVRHISHRVAILYSGRMVEIADRDSLYEHPRHPYTEALLSAVPVPHPETQRARKRLVYRGDIPDVSHWPAGCHFHGRCPLADERCSLQAPPLQGKADHLVACWHR